MMQNIHLKGVKDGVRLIITPSATMGNVISELQSKIDQSLDLFKAKGDVVLHVEAPTLSFVDKLKIQDIVLKKHPETVFSFEHSEKMPAPTSVFHTGTLRSGQNLHSDAHLVILGDVNPGAEISAVGNVVVLGALRGIVHAGTSGDRSASVSALLLNPTQIRIADIITRAPDETSEMYGPEIAYIKDERIYIDSLVKK
ncbi:MAG: septum site-determining protein MinC [Clostridia bacterium]|nr:septum site-determining protein MinC [Clostridia bacterium]